MVVAVIDYGSGNLRSVAKALERASAEADLPLTITVTDDTATVRRASHIVLPGVGAFPDCKRGLARLPGMYKALEQEVHGAEKPFLGICVGMQLMAHIGMELDETPGFGWIDGEVDVIRPDNPRLKIPQMGWNDLQIKKPEHPVFDGLTSGVHAYFVHSYHFICGNPNHVLATVDYGGTVTAAVGCRNMIGTQFHPEKSQATGLRLLTNFLKWQP